MRELIQLSVPGMKCGGCVSSIEAALNNEVGVTYVDISLETKTVSVKSNLPASTLIGALKVAGYEATEDSAEYGERA